MKTVFTLMLGFALLLGTAALITASAQETTYRAPITGLEPERSGAVQAPAGPMGHVGPGDLPTTPEERERLEKEHQERLHSPAAMDRQMDGTEHELREGRR